MKSNINQTTPPSGLDGIATAPGAGLHLEAVPAERTPPVAVAVADQDDLLAAVEARLAEEVIRLADALTAFGRATQAIHEELPAASQFGKLITAFFSTFSFQIAYALLKDGNQPLLVDDGALCLHKMGLKCNEFFRELEMDGRRFLAVALVEQRQTEILEDHQAATDPG